MATNGWVNSTHAARRPPDWHKRRARILRRDNRICQIRLDGCTTEATQVDHIVPGDNHDDSNLQAACAWCNARKNIAQRPRPKRISAKRKPERHPGLSY